MNRYEILLEKKPPESPPHFIKEGYDVLILTERFCPPPPDYSPHFATSIVFVPESYVWGGNT